MSRKLVVAVSTTINGENVKSVSTGADPINRHCFVTEASFARVTRMADSSDNKQVTELVDGFGFTFFHNSDK
jgi:hypothetical protein